MRGAAAAVVPPATFFTPRHGTGPAVGLANTNGSNVDQGWVHWTAAVDRGDVIPLLSSVAKMQTPAATKYRLITIDERCYSGHEPSPRRGGPSKLFLLLVFLLSHSSQDKFELILDSYRIIRAWCVRRLRAGCDLRKPKTAFCFFIANNQPRTNTRCAFFIFLRITRESRPPCSLDTTAHSVRSCAGLQHSSL